MVETDVIAKIEKEGGIRASYYFRIVKESYDEDVIRQITEMGHEIGYHYENLSEISRKKEVREQMLIGHRRTQTDTDVLAERLARIKMVIASRKKSQKESSLREKTEISLRPIGAYVPVGGQMSEVRRARARDRDPQITQIDADYLIGRRHTRTDADIYPADFAGQKESSLRETEEFRDKFFELAICDFERDLEKLRKLYPVKTICMHGSPLSKWDNRD